MNYKKIYLKLLNELRDDIMKGMGFRLKNIIAEVVINSNVNMYKKNINFLYKLKCEIKENTKIWNKEIFNNYINTLEDGISNITNGEDYYTDKYIIIINQYKNIACIENI